MFIHANHYVTIWKDHLFIIKSWKDENNRIQIRPNISFLASVPISFSTMRFMCISWFEYQQREIRSRNLVLEYKNCRICCNLYPITFIFSAYTEKKIPFTTPPKWSCMNDHTKVKITRYLSTIFFGSPCRWVFLIIGGYHCLLL